MLFSANNRSAFLCCSSTVAGILTDRWLGWRAGDLGRAFGAGAGAAAEAEGDFALLTTAGEDALLATGDRPRFGDVS